MCICQWWYNTRHAVHLKQNMHLKIFLSLISQASISIAPTSESRCRLLTVYIVYSENYVVRERIKAEEYTILKKHNILYILY